MNIQSLKVQIYIVVLLKQYDILLKYKLASVCILSQYDYKHLPQCIWSQEDFFWVACEVRVYRVGRCSAVECILWLRSWMHRGTRSYHFNISLKIKFLEILLSSLIKSNTCNDEGYFEYLHTFKHSLSSGDITQAYIFVV